MQGLVAGEQRPSSERSAGDDPSAPVDAGRGEGLVAPKRRRQIRDRFPSASVQTPPVRMRRISEAAVEERSDEVERQARPCVSPEQSPRVGLPRVGGRIRSIDEIATVCGQGVVADLFDESAAGLGVLPRDSSHDRRRPAGDLLEDQTHLQEDLQLRRNRIGRAVLEAFGAVATLQEQTPSLGGLGEFVSKALDLVARDERRQAAKFRQRRAVGRGIGVGHALRIGRRRCPRRRLGPGFRGRIARDVGWGGCRGHGASRSRHGVGRGEAQTRSVEREG